MSAWTASAPLRGHVRAREGSADARLPELREGGIADPSAPTLSERRVANRPGAARGSCATDNRYGPEHLAVLGSRSARFAHACADREITIAALTRRAGA